MQLFTQCSGALLAHPFHRRPLSPNAYIFFLPLLCISSYGSYSTILLWHHGAAVRCSQQIWTVSLTFTLAPQHLARGSRKKKNLINILLNEWMSPEWRRPKIAGKSCYWNYILWCMVGKQKIDILSPKYALRGWQRRVCLSLISSSNLSRRCMWCILDIVECVSKS